MTNDEKIVNIESQAVNLYCLISVLMESCETKDYTHQRVVLEYAKKVSLKIIAKLSDFNMEWTEDYFAFDLD